MRKDSGMNYIFFVLIILFAACKKNETSSQILPTQADTPITAPTPPPVATGPSYSKTYEVGTGSGDLVINGSAYTLGGTVLFKIKGGSYKSIKIANVDGGANGLVTFQNNGLVESTGEMRLENLNKVVLSGNGTSGIEKGFLFQNIGYRAIQVDGTINNFTLQYFAFKNIGDNVITYKYETAYTGAEGSYSQNLKFLNIDCDNTGQLISGSGSSNNGVLQGFIKNLEIAYVNYQNSPKVGSIVWFGNVENYDIHHNTVNNVNTANDNHNGIFLMNGNGQFHHNRISNHQGNAIRAHSFTVGSTPKDVLIYNNIVFNSRKYSAFEVQGFGYSITPGKTTYVNAKIFNNTCGSLNSSNDWQGNVVDVYSLFGGKCNVFNNVAYNLPAPYVIAGQESDLIPTSSNNFYFKTSREAGIIDENNFKLTENSPLKNKGIAEPLLTTDFYGVARASNPSVGAVE